MQGIHEEISSPRRKNKTQQQTISKVNYLVTPTKKKSTWSRLILPKYVESIDLFFVVNDYGKLGNEK